MDNGNLVGWYVDAQPWGWQVLSPDLLEELALSEPTTFDELLDVSKVLFDSGLLSRDYVLSSNTGTRSRICSRSICANS